MEILLQMKATEKNLGVSKEVKDYKNSVVSHKNEGDNENTVSQYKISVKILLNLTWIM